MRVKFVLCDNRYFQILVDVIHYWLRGVNVPPKLSHSGSSTSISDNPTPGSGHGSYTPIVTPQMLQEVLFFIENAFVVVCSVKEKIFQI